MQFEKTKISGVYKISPKKIEDSRGFFARTFCQQEFEKYNLKTNWVQQNISFNKFAGTIRGMHYQKAPFSEAKLISCRRGQIFLVVLDIRPDSVTFQQSESFELNDFNYETIYLPAGLANGFQTLVDNTEIFYQMSEYFHPDSAEGIRYNDSFWNISWPLTITEISPKDQCWPDYPT